MNVVSELGLGGQWNDRPWNRLSGLDQQLACAYAAHAGSLALCAVPVWPIRERSLRYQTFLERPSRWLAPVREQTMAPAERSSGIVSVEFVPGMQSIASVIAEVVPDDL